MLDIERLLITKIPDIAPVYGGVSSITNESIPNNNDIS